MNNNYPIWRDANRLLLEVEQAVRRVNVCQVGYMKDGLKRRRVRQLFIRSGVELCPISKNH